MQVAVDVRILACCSSVQNSSSSKKLGGSFRAETYFRAKDSVARTIFGLPRSCRSDSVLRVVLVSQYFGPNLRSIKRKLNNPWNPHWKTPSKWRWHSRTSRTAPHKWVLNSLPTKHTGGPSKRAIKHWCGWEDKSFAIIQAICMWHFHFELVTFWF